MKVSKISIKDFHQFKDLTIDLTYPKGHDKEGQPLDKVCFIGQSGTGKTTLLEMIPYLLYEHRTALIQQVEYSKINYNIEVDVYIGYENEIKFNVRYESDDDHPHKLNWQISKALTELDKKEVMDYLKNDWIRYKSSKSIYFPAMFDYDINRHSQDSLGDGDIVDFSIDKISSVWGLLIEKVQTYQEKELQLRQNISKVVEQNSDDLHTIKKALKKLEDWKVNEPNPIQDLADNCFDYLLKHFKLKVKTELDIKGKYDIGFIKIEDFNGNEIPNGLWSTGTKQVILSALPLYLLKPKNTIILFDEPERSLYPDLQRTLVDYYATLADNCQFFYATHSPIIASSFDPWEIVELKFDGEGHVQRELYYEGENHIDNYKWNPKYMRWDDILLRIFDMENDGSDERRKKLDELAKQNVKYRKLEQRGNTDSDDAKKVLDAIQHLSKELSHWD